MHPRHKLKYFERAGWPKSWIQQAVEMVREEYDTHYRHLTQEARLDDTTPTDESDESDEDAAQDDELRPRPRAPTRSSSQTSAPKRTSAPAPANGAMTHMNSVREVRSLFPLHLLSWLTRFPK